VRSTGCARVQCIVCMLVCSDAAGIAVGLVVGVGGRPSEGATGSRRAAYQICLAHRVARGVQTAEEICEPLEVEGDMRSRRQT
jgi:hypothetical protein